MKNKNIINFNIPVNISNFTKLENGRTLAKLRVMYVGETGDGRIIEEFAESIKEQLPGCPVVAFYSSIKEDFVGHNKTQYIYGVVNGSEFGFVEDGDTTWLETEVILYTDRADTSEVASKIVGQPQSLELKDMTYEIIEKDGKKKFKITGGNLIGLSVLGTKQRPAFTGAGFFANFNAADLTERFTQFIATFSEENKGEQGETMDKFKELCDFKIRSYRELFSAVHKAINEALGDSCFYVHDIYNENQAIVELYEDGNYVFKRINFSIEGEAITIGDSVSVKRYFMTEEEYNKASSSSKPEGQNAFSDTQQTEEPEVNEPSTIEENTTPENFENNSSQNTGEGNEPNQDTQTSENQQDPASQDPEGQTVFTALDDSERQELENFRREKKINLINSFSELDKEVLDEFINKVDELTYDEIDNSLSKEFVKFTRLNTQGNTEPTVIIDKEEENADLGAFAEIVRRYRAK